MVKKQFYGIKKLIDNFGKNEWILILEIGIYVIVFSILTILRFYSLQTYAYDLGNYNQALYTTLFDGKFLFYTTDITANPSGNLFGVHFSPIFLLMLPIYALLPSPSTILIIQSIFLALGAVPIYLIAIKKLENRNWGLVFATLYLLNPAVQGVNWYDFHPEAFLPVFILFSFYFYDSKMFGRFFASIFLTLICLEFSAILIIFLLFYLIIETKPWIRNSYIRHSKELKIISITFLFSLLWLLFSLWVIQRVNPVVQPLTGNIYWGEVGANSLLEIPGQVISNPMTVVGALSYDGLEKLGYLLALLGFVGFLPIFKPLIFICFMPWVPIAFISNFPSFYQLGTQYPTFLIPFLFYGAILGMRKLLGLTIRVNYGVKLKRIAYALIILPLVLFPFFSPLNGGPFLSYPHIKYGVPSINEHSEQVLGLVNLIPPKAAVITQNNIFPLVSSRSNAYMFPIAVRYPPEVSFYNVLDDLLNSTEFILVDMKSDVLVSALVLSYPLVAKDFGLYASADGAILLKRNYSDNPILFEPINEIFNHDSLVFLDGTVIIDENSNSGKVVFLSKSSRDKTDFWYGPYIFLPPGRYETVFRIKIENPTVGDLITLDISSFIYTIDIEYAGSKKDGYHLLFNLKETGEKENFGSIKLNYPEINETDQYLEFNIEFFVDSFGTFEFRGVDPEKNADIYIDEIRLIQIQPSGKLNLEIQEDFSLK